MKYAAIAVLFFACGGNVDAPPIVDASDAAADVVDELELDASADVVDDTCYPAKDPNCFGDK